MVELQMKEITSHGRSIRLGIDTELVPRVAKRERPHVSVTFLSEVRWHNLFPTRPKSFEAVQEIHRIARTFEPQRVAWSGQVGRFKVS